MQVNVVEAVPKLGTFAVTVIVPVEVLEFATMSKVVVPEFIVNESVVSWLANDTAAPVMDIVPLIAP